MRSTLSNNHQHRGIDLFPFRLLIVPTKKRGPSSGSPHSSLLSRRRLISLAVAATLVLPNLALARSTQANAALTYLRQKMDQYLNFDVYADRYSVGNHFEPSGWMGDASPKEQLAIEVDPGCTDTWHTGGNSFRITYTGAGNAGWAGIYWRHPADNSGGDPDGGFDLSGATKVTFWARGAHGGEKAEFKMGGIDGTYGDSVRPAISTGVLTLTRTWKRYTIPLTGKDLSHVVGGFVWVTNRVSNPHGATIYVDDVRYEGLNNKLRLIESYTNLTDFVPLRPLATNRYLYVYRDYEPPGEVVTSNAFAGIVRMGDHDAASVDMNETLVKHGGTSAMRWHYSSAETQGQKWAGAYWQAPANFWGDRVGGYDLTGATRLTFWARGEEGGENVGFMVGGITGPYNDSVQPARETVVIPLTTTWTKYTIPLSYAKLTRIGGGFAWSAEKAANPNGVTFYLDDIRYENPSSSGKVYQTDHDPFPPDAYSMLAAHTYDNALALLAFLSTSNSSDAARARLLADSLVWAQQHDEFNDGRLRNVYYPDNLATGTTSGNHGNTARHNTDTYGNGAGPGNMGWAMIALLNYYQAFGGEPYKNSALAMGQYLYTTCYDTRGNGGYTAGYNGFPPSDAVVLTYKSTEHNIDVYVAFMKLYEVTSDPTWKERAMHAKTFVASMWDNAGAYFKTGTQDDGVNDNLDNYPVDTMPWGFLAMGEVGKYGRGLASALNRHYASETLDGYTFEGVDFNNDQDGVWWEGTAQMVTAWWPLYSFGFGTGKTSAKANALKFRDELREAQLHAPRNDGKGMVATLHDELTTGFDLPTGKSWYYYNRLHVGATAWFIFAEEKWNPYWGIAASQPIPYQNDYGD